MHKCLTVIFAVVTIFCTHVSAEEEKPAQDAEAYNVEGTVIRGTTELPKVLYIVPWKKSQLGDIMMQSGANTLSNELAPLDREIFKRQIEYYEMLHKE
jgi:hypothetical protein